MFKKSSKALLLLGSLLLTQCNPIKAGGYPDSGDAFLVIGLAGVGIRVVGGTVGSVALYKSFQWAKNGTGLKKYLGYGFLTTAGVATLVGLGYGWAKINSK